MVKEGIRERGKDDGCCGVFFLKYVIYIFNLIFWISGGGILAVGIWTLLMRHHYISLLASMTYAATTYILIAAGGIIILVGFIGCCGAWKENRGCLMTYATFLLLIFLLEAVAGVLAYIYQANVREELTMSLNQTMLDNYMFDKTKTKAIDALHQEFDCCGAFNFMDWRHSEWYKSKGSNLTEAVPESCCITMMRGCTIRGGELRDHPSNIYYEGCIQSLTNFLREHLIILGAVGLGLCVIEIFGIIFACCLAKSIKEYEERQNKYNYSY